MKPNWRLLRLLSGLIAAVAFLNALWPVVVRHQPGWDWRQLLIGVVFSLLAWSRHRKVRAEEKLRSGSAEA